jgi:hypothetical protein
MNRQISNPAELAVLKIEVPQIILNHISEKAIERLKELVKEKVYSYPVQGDGEGNYIEHGGGDVGRTEEFANAWGEIASSANWVQVGYLLDDISLEPDAYIHGSRWGEIDAETLADYIFGGYKVFRTGHEIPARNAWEDFVGELPTNIPLWINEGMAKL